MPKRDPDLLIEAAQVAEPMDVSLASEAKNSQNSKIETKPFFRMRLLQYPTAVRADLVVHGVRGQIDP